MTKTRQRQRGQREESGAVGVLVALLFGFFVVTGLLAWSVDAGQIFLERRQTQSAADAAALALAQSCAKANCNLNADSLPALVNANTINSASRTHAIERQCKSSSAIVGTLPVCTSTPSVSQLRECPPMPPGTSGLPYVEVRVRAQDNGQPVIANPFTQVNNGGPDTSSVISCARAAWGIPSSSTFVAPFTISLCEWEAFSNHGLNYAPAPVAPWPGYGNTGAGQPPWPAGPTSSAIPREIVIYLHGRGDVNCGAGPSGSDTPGGFGWLMGSGCTATATATNGVDYWAAVDTGSSPPSGCSARMAAARDSGPVIDLPIYDCINDIGVGAVTPAMNCDDGHGSNARYHLAGIARFYVSGYKISGSDDRVSRITNTVPCSGSGRCVSGWFVSGVLSAPTGSLVPPTSSNPGFGLTAVIAAG